MSATSRPSLARWAFAVAAIAVLGFWLFSRNSNGSEISSTAPPSATSAASSAPTASTGAGATEADTASPEAPSPPTEHGADGSASDGEGAAPVTGPAPPTTVAPTTPTTFKMRADGTYEPTGAGQGAYPTYPGGDFDDTSPNTITSAGVDENGCDNNYSGACVPPLPARVTCADIGIANFEVVLGDPQGFDPDRDTIACDDERIIRTEQGETGQPDD